MSEVRTIEPQPGYQTAVLSSPADIVISGGAAGAGKTFSLLLEPLRHVDVDNFGAVIFRRTSPQIRAEGGLWDASRKLYDFVDGARPRETFLEWRFSDTSKLNFSHLEYEKNLKDWQGAEITYLGFDELTHFSENMFFYLLSRNRSTCGVRPYCRATCNPDPDSWVAKLVEWWIDQETGFPIPERQGVLRYFMRDNDNYIWGDTVQEVIDQGWHALELMVQKSGLPAEEFIKSITFIGGTIYENKALLQVDPGYLANLNALPAELKAQLMDGNWKVKITDKDIYDYHKFRDIFTNKHVKPGRRCITADIALKGSDKFLALAWDGKIVIDFIVYPKSSGKKVVRGIENMATKQSIPNSNILFDNDGLGQFLGGIDDEDDDAYLPNAKEFHNGGRPFPNPIKPLRDQKGNILPEPYENLKAQCYYRSGDAVARAEYYIPPEVADRMFDETMTFKDRLMFERKAIKKKNPDGDGKKGIIPKTEMKAYLGGQSPDALDAFMMREWFEFTPVRKKPKARF